MTKLSGIAVNSTDVLVSVSGPGITYSHTKYQQTKDIKMEWINQRTINIYNDRDIVPWIDQQEGLIQVITCPANYSLFECHEVKKTLCNLVQLCGNSQRFTLNPEMCEN